MDGDVSGLVNGEGKIWEGITQWLLGRCSRSDETREGRGLRVDS
jgi:hypothetical protein